MVTLRIYCFILVHQFSCLYLEFRMHINMTVCLGSSVLCQRSTNTTLREVPQGCSSKSFTIACALLVEGSEELKMYMQHLYDLKMISIIKIFLKLC